MLFSLIKLITHYILKLLNIYYFLKANSNTLNIYYDLCHSSRKKRIVSGVVLFYFFLGNFKKIITVYKIILKNNFKK